MGMCRKLYIHGQSIMYYHILRYKCNGHVQKATQTQHFSMCVCVCYLWYCLLLESWEMTVGEQWWFSTPRVDVLLLFKNCQLSFSIFAYFHKEWHPWILPPITKRRYINWAYMICSYVIISVQLFQWCIYYNHCKYASQRVLVGFIYHILWIFYAAIFTFTINLKGPNG